MQIKTADRLMYVCFGTAFLGGIGSFVGINQVDNENTMQFNNYALAASSLVVLSSFLIGLGGVYFSKLKYRIYEINLKTQDQKINDSQIKRNLEKII